MFREARIQEIVRRDPNLEEAIGYSLRAFNELFYTKGVKEWIATYSGGKDSTLVAMLAVHALQELAPLGLRLKVVYSDTLLEIPPLWENARAFLDQIKGYASRHGLPISTHRVAPPPEETFWVLLIGKGYPSPKRYFRWCTKRLKIRPVESLMASLKRPIAVLTGMRLGESDGRNARMKATCSQDAECGHDLWLNRKAEGVYYLAPIVHWRTCKVWDFHTFIAPLLGWDTSGLSSLYNGDPIRFGCWTCTIVKEDKALEQVIKRPCWSYLEPLGDLRRFLDEGRKPENRVVGPTGKLSKMTLEFRQVLLERVLKVQEAVGIALISVEESTFIQQLWAAEREAETEHAWLK